MDVTSLGNRTDLALLRLGGTEVEDKGDHLVVRSPHNPTFWWGNFLLLAQVPPAVDTDRWMTASAVHAPPRPNHEATYRKLASDADWAQSVELRMACNDEDEKGAAHLEFTTRRAATNRGLTEAGHGAWFGAFVDGRLLSQMGLVAASPGLARFQSVETHPDARGQGLAGTLVHRVSQYGFGELGAATLVMVADPEYSAIRLYRSVGFADTESQLQAQRAPSG